MWNKLKQIVDWTLGIVCILFGCFYLLSQGLLIAINMIIGDPVTYKMIGNCSVFILIAILGWIWLNIRENRYKNTPKGTEDETSSI